MRLNFTIFLLLGVKFARLSITFAENYACGIPNGILRSHWIHGGTPAEMHSWPWIASLKRMSNSNHFCTGAMISKRFVLTSAHCFGISYNLEPDSNSLYVSFGCHQMSVKSDKESWRAVRKVHIHPLYQKPNVYKMSYDIALVELMSEPDDPDTARQACLPPLNSFLQSGEQCVVLGWGKTEVSPYSDILLQATIPIMSITECTGKDVWSDYVDKTMICAGDYGPHRSGPCQGDSGAPLLCKRTSTQWSVYGVVSWGTLSCGERPSVFTNVAYMMDWIIETFQYAGEKIEFAKTIIEPDGNALKRAKVPDGVHFSFDMVQHFHKCKNCTSAVKLCK